MWDTKHKERFKRIVGDIFNGRGEFEGTKTVEMISGEHYITNWISRYREKNPVGPIGFLDGTNSNDIAHNHQVYIKNSKDQVKNPRGLWITRNNFWACVVYTAVRCLIEKCWHNDRDQYLVPLDKWETDEEFQVNCLTWVMFSSYMNISSSFGVNHWIPFTEKEVGATDCFASHFMTDLLSGKLADQTEDISMLKVKQGKFDFIPLKCLSLEAKSVMDAGRELWRYYHSKTGVNVNASYYDIQRYFQGTKTTKKGRVIMNSKSSDSVYTKLMSELRNTLEALGEQIKPKIYEYRFLIK